MTPLTEAELIARAMQRCDQILAGTERKVPLRMTETPVQRQSQRAQLGAKG